MNRLVIEFFYCSKILNWKKIKKKI
jgi:hypothetical protein